MLRSRRPSRQNVHTLVHCVPKILGVCLAPPLMGTSHHLRGCSVYKDGLTSAPIHLLPGPPPHHSHQSQPRLSTGTSCASCRGKPPATVPIREGDPEQRNAPWKEALQELGSWPAGSGTQEMEFTVAPKTCSSSAPLREPRPSSLVLSESHRVCREYTACPPSSLCRPPSPAPANQELLPGASVSRCLDARPPCGLLRPRLP